jgi:methylase of polypeptide subunit release factors
MTADELYQQAFRAEIAALSPASLCDVGCGAGALVAHARSLGVTAAGIEPDVAKVADGTAAGLTCAPGRRRRCRCPTARSTSLLSRTPCTT